MFTVALIGRPNVGKSTLFNKLIGRKRAIVHDEPGVTRDWREGEAKIGGITFRVLDTAGLEEAFDDSLAARMRQQTEQALGQADLALFMIDARVGVTPTDEHFAKWLRTAGIETWVIANKCEGRAFIKLRNITWRRPGLFFSHPSKICFTCWRCRPSCEPASSAHMIR